jgi:hypothetical protein
MRRLILPASLIVLASLLMLQPFVYAYIASADTRLTIGFEFQNHNEISVLTKEAVKWYSAQ